MRCSDCRMGRYVFWKVSVDCGENGLGAMESLDGTTSEGSEEERALNGGPEIDGRPLLAEV